MKLQLKPMTDCIAYVFAPEGAPPIIDTERLNTGIPVDGYPHVFDPVYQQPSVFSDKPVFVGWEKVRLRWMKPGTGGLVPR